MKSTGMHMHNGVGRTGYLLITLSFFLMGGFGVAVSVLAFEAGTRLFFQVGVALAAFGLLTLLAFALFAPWIDRPQGRRLPLPERPRQEMAKATVPVPKVRTRGGKQWTGDEPAFEFEDISPAGHDGARGSGASAAPVEPRGARETPTEFTVPPAFQDGPDEDADPTVWPQQRGKGSDWSARVRREQEVREQVEESPVRREMAEKYTRNTPTVRSMLQQEDVPTSIAERAPEGVGPGFAAPGMSVGRCGQCSTALLAPDARPLRLKCPECAKVTLLQ